MTQQAEPRHKMTVKIVDSLRTIQGYTLDEYQMARAELMDDMKEDLELVQMAKAVSAAAPIAAPPRSAPTVAAPASGWETAGPPAAFQAGAVPVGPDGRPRVAKAGSSAKGPWKAWMTAAKKGEPGYDEPIWIRRGTPEWDSHPA